eukprot:108692-Pelagomonas_calceolata.AAC.1
MLNRLKAYAHRKFLTVNTKKYFIVCFNSKTGNLPPLFYDGEVLPYSNTFRCLGMQFDKHINLHIAAEEALKPWQAWLAYVLLPINTRLHTAYMPSYGSSRRMPYQQECMQVRYGPLHIFNRVDG